MTTTLENPVSTSVDWERDVELLGEFEAFKDRISGAKRHGGNWLGRCPAHDDTDPSLSFTQGVVRKTVATCHAGCSFRNIREAVFPGWEERVGDTVLESKETIYSYRDESGDVLFEVVRGANRKFWQRHWDEPTQKWILNVEGVRRVPYRLPELLEAVANDQTVFIVEGEKDADRLAQAGLVATTNPSGAGKWKDNYSEHLASARVVIVPDNDEPGRKHADKVLTSLSGTARSTAILTLPGLADKGDVSDWLDDGHTVGELVELADRAPKQEPCGLRVFTLRELSELPPTEYTIEGFIQKQGFNLLVGASSTGKTFAALDMSLSIATDTPWHGRTVQPGTVLYIAAEGMTGMNSRVDAWRQTHEDLDVDRIGFASEPLNLLSTKDFDLILQAVTRQRADVVVIDPLARFMEGADENSAKDMTAAVGAFSRIQAETGATLLVPHHTGKDPSRGARGSTVVFAAADQVMTMKSTGAIVEIRVDKARDLAGGDYVRLYLEPTGRSAVFRTAGPAHDQTGSSPDERQALQALANIRDGATSSDWEKTSGMEKSAFQRARKALSETGLISGGGGKGKPYQVTSEGFEALGQPGTSEP